MTAGGRRNGEAGESEGGYGPSLIQMDTIRAFLWLQRYLLIAVTLLVFLIALGATLLMIPVYQAQSTVRIDTSGAQIVEGQDLTSQYIHPSDVDRHLQTLAAVITSRRLGAQVADMLDLHQNPDFVGDMATQAAPAGMTQAQWDQRRQQRAAGTLSGSVVTEVPFDSQLIRIIYRSSDPAMAANIANAYADAFLLRSVTEGSETNSYAREYLEEQIADVSGRLQAAEVEAVSYARNNRLVGQPITSGATGSEGAAVGIPATLTASNLIQVNQNFTEARARRIAAEQRWLAVANIPAGQLPEVQQNASIQTLRTQLATANSELRDMRERYRDDYPALRELEARAQSMEQAIESASAEVKRAIRDEFHVAQRQESALLGELGRVSDETLDEQGRRVEYNLMDREANALRTQLAALLERYNQIVAASNLQANNATLLDYATVPSTPSSPNLWRNLLMGLILGGALAVGLAIMRQFFDDRIRSVDEVERKLGLPMIGQTPHVAGDALIEVDNAFGPLGESYASIRASIDYALGERPHAILQVTSSQPGEGKTLTCIAIAKKFASVGQKVLLLELDVRRPAVCQTLDMPAPKSGLLDVLFAHTTLDRAVVRAPGEQFDVLAVSKRPDAPVEVLSSGLVGEFLKNHRGYYDKIVIDSPPVIGIADAPLISRFADATVFVVEANVSRARPTRVAIRRLQDMGANVIGVILTKFRALEAGQSYNYQYQYYSYETKAD